MTVIQNHAVVACATESEVPGPLEGASSAIEVATPEEVAMMFGQLPPPVKVLWHLIGKRKYRRYMTLVRCGQLG